MTATITDLLHESAAAWPERLAVSTPTGVDALRYRDLEALAAELAAQLRRSGVQEGDAVAIVSDNSLEYVLALFAITTLRAAAAPLNAQLAALQLRQRLDSLRARAVIVPARLYGDFVSAHAG